MRFLARATAVAVLLTSTVVVADEGPSVELAPVHRAPKPPVALGTGPAPEDAYLRGMTEQRFRNAGESSSSTAIGGYGEAQLDGTAVGSRPRAWTANLSRLILF